MQESGVGSTDVLAFGAVDEQAIDKLSKPRSVAAMHPYYLDKIYSCVLRHVLSEGLALLWYFGG